MQPAAVLSVLVTTEGVGPSNAKLNSVQSTLRKTQAVADTAGTSVASAGKKIEKAGAGISKFGKAATKYYATPLLVAAGASLYFAQKYEKSMLMVQTHTDTNRRDLALYKREILEMGRSGKYTQGPNELAEAMYHIASDGFKGKKATDMLRKSADLAMVGQSGLAQTTYALVSAMKTQIRGTETSADAINTLNAIVGAGDMKMEDLVGAMSTGILPAAKAMGLSLKDVGVAEDIMTQRGVPAQQAAYRLAMTFQMLIPHTEKAQDAFEQIGLSQMSLINAMNAHPQEGLLAMLRLLHQHLKSLGDSQHQIQTIEEIFGGGRTSRGAITLLQNLDSVEETYGRINQLAGETPKKIQQAKAAPVNKLREAWVQVQTVLTELGSDLIPLVAAGITDLAGMIQHVATVFHSLPPGMQMGIIKFLALTVALAFLIRIIGFFVKSFGMLLGWFAKGESETALLIASNEALAASYAETAVAAEASAAAQTAAIEEVAVAQKIAMAAQVGGMPIGWKPGQQSMSQLIPGAAEEAGQMSLFASAPRAAATVAPEAEAAAASVGGGMATAVAGGLASMLPPALAAIGLGNILISVLGGDTKSAAYKGGGAVGGAIIGGILGSVIPGAGTVAGALAGAGIGSLLGGVAESIFGGDGKEMAKYQKAVQEASEKVADQLKRQKAAAHAFNKVSDQVDKSQKRHRTTSHQLEKAEAAVTRATNKYGASSRQAAKATERLNRAKSEAVQANRRLANAEKLQGVVRTAVMRADKTAIANIREKKQALAEELGVLYKRLRIVQKQPPSEERDKKERNKLNEINKTKRALEEQKSAEEKIFSSARVQIGGKFVKALEKINPQMYNLKKAAHAAGEGVKEYQESFRKALFGQDATPSLESIINHFKKVHDKAGDAGKQIAGPFKNQSKTGFDNAATSAKNFDKTTTSALGDVGTNMNNMLSKMGASPINFSSKNEAGQKASKKQRGGAITEGAASGDSVHAMLEKGEYVVNREAVAKVGVHKLNELNFGMAPRFFQEGGSVLTGMGVHRSYPGLSGDTDFAVQLGFALSKMATSTGTHISVASGWRSMAEQAALYNAYKNGSGNLAAPPSPNAPHVRGGAADISPGRETFGGTAGRFGMGFTVPSESWHIELLNAIMGAKGAFGLGATPKVPGVKLMGPEGDLLKIGQGSIDKVLKAAQNYVNKAAPHGIGGLNVATGPVVQMAKQMVEQIWGMGEWGSFNALEMSEAGWDPRAENPSSGAAGLAQALPPSKYPPGAWPYQGLKSAQLQLEWMMGYIKDRYGTPSAAWDFHQANNWYQEGGPVESFLKAGGEADPKKSKKSSIEKSIKSTLKGLGSGKHLPKYQAHLKKIGRKIGKIDLPHSQMERLGQMSKEAERFSEYASNASTLTTSDEDGNITQGIFKGGNEGSWLERELTSLISLRSQVISSHEVIANNTLPRIMKLLKHTQERLRKAQKAIREDEAKKRELEKKIKDLEKAQNDNINKLEKEKKNLENQLNQAQNAKNPNRQQIDNIRDQIRSKNEAINSSNKEATAAIKDDHEKIRDLDKDINSKKRIESGAKTLIGDLTERRSSLYTTMSDLFGSGGEFEGTGLSFYGLEQIQGKGGTTGSIANPPELGSVGGEIFDIQARLKQIQEETSKKNPTTPPDESELAELEKEIALEWKKRYLVSQSQFATLASFPGVSQIASVPSAGNYAVGGLVAATVGERGQEVAVMPTGSRVVPEHDAKEAISRMGGGGGDIVFEELNVYTEEGKVTGRVNGRDFEEDIQKAERKTARKSMSRTPGGKGLRK